MKIGQYVRKVVSQIETGYKSTGNDPVNCIVSINLRILLIRTYRKFPIYIQVILHVVFEHYTTLKQSINRFIITAVFFNVSSIVVQTLVCALEIMLNKFTCWSSL